jgi:hypothetical protein
VERKLLLLAGLGLAGGGLAYWWVYGRHEEPGGVLGDLNQILDALTSIGRGSRLTRAPYDTTTGVVPGSPAELAAQAGLDVETYSLARAIASEEGRSSALTKIAVGWAIKNYCAKHGTSITGRVTNALTPSHAGSYGTQRDIEEGTDHYNGSDRYCSTALDPYDQDGQIAVGILTGAIPDPTDGADQFDRPAGEKDPDQVAANRVSSGAELVQVDGVDGLRFWRTSS